MTNGTSRQSSRPSSVAGRAASASAISARLKTCGNAVGMDRDQADGALALERAEPLHDRAGRQAEPAVARHFDRDEIAVLGAAGVVARDRQFAAELLLVDRHQAAAAVRAGRERYRACDAWRGRSA